MKFLILSKTLLYVKTAFHNMNYDKEGEGTTVTVEQPAPKPGTTTTVETPGK